MENQCIDKNSISRMYSFKDCTKGDFQKEIQLSELRDEAYFSKVWAIMQIGFSSFNELFHPLLQRKAVKMLKSRIFSKLFYTLCHQTLVSYTNVFFYYNTKLFIFLWVLATEW